MRAFGWFLVLSLVLSSLAGVVWAQRSRLPERKKLIEYGWDVPTPEFVRAHIRQMEQKPFDGLIFRLKGPHGGRIFQGGKWKEADYVADFADLRAIQWEKFTDNFLMMYAASDMDWFSDSDWEGVLSNVRLMARAAKAGRCGLAFDAEPYGKNPWAYKEQKWAQEKSWEQYKAKVFERGQQFIRAIESELPRCTLVTLFTYSLFRGHMDQKDPVKLQETLQGEGYGLYLPFLNGVLTAMGPGITLTDGNEPSYYYTDSESYFSVYHAMRQGALKLIPRAMVDKFLTQTQASQALYMDYVFARVPWKGIPALWMTPEEQAQWFQHNVYYALKTADEYVWLYSEKMSWWEDRDIPPGMEEAVVKARELIARGQPLGYSMDEIMQRVRAKQEQELAEKLIRRRADIPRLRGVPPVLDGEISEPAWQGAARLEPFVPTFGNEPDSLKAATVAQVTWDDAHLYIAVDCAEPDMAALKIIGSAHDDPVWEGDSLDVILSADPSGTPYLHFIVNPQGVRWDARFTSDNDVSWSPDWRVGAARTGSGWTVEAAIPWSALGLSPQPGLSLRANLCRNRQPGGGELSSWSQVVRGFLEPQHSGEWVLR